MLMLRSRKMWLRQDLMRLFYMITSKDNSMWRLVGLLRIAQVVVKHIKSTYMSMQAHVVKHFIYGFPCNHILAACHFRSVDFRSLVQHYYSTQSYYNSWASLFHPIFNVYEWPPYDGLIIVPLSRWNVHKWMT